MISSLVIYFAAFIISSFACYFYDKIADSCQKEIETKRLENFRLYLYKRDFLKLLCAFIILLPPVFLATFRGLTVGTDTEAYLYDYEKLKVFGLYEYLTVYGTVGMTTEIGYQQINRFAYLSGGGYNLVKFISSFLTLFFVWRGTRYYHDKFQVNSGFCMFFFYMLEYEFCLNGVRFAIALGILFYAFQFVIEKDFYKYLLCCFGMILFHVAMSIALPFYLISFLGYKKMPKYWKYIAIVIVIVSVVFLDSITYYLFPFFTSVFPKLAAYRVTGFSGGGTVVALGLAFRVLLLFLPLLRWNSFIRMHIDWVCIMIVIMMYIPFRSLGILSQWLSRLSRMPEIFLCVFYCGAMKLPVRLTEKLFWKVYVVVITILYFGYMVIRHNNGDIMPYVFDFTNYI